MDGRFAISSKTVATKEGGPSRAIEESVQVSQYSISSYSARDQKSLFNELRVELDIDMCGMDA